MKPASPRIERLNRSALVFATIPGIESILPDVNGLAASGEPKFVIAVELRGVRGLANSGSDSRRTLRRV